MRAHSSESHNWPGGEGSDHFTEKERNPAMASGTSKVTPVGSGTGRLHLSIPGGKHTSDIDFCHQTG